MRADDKRRKLPDSNTSIFNKMSIRVTITDDHTYGAAECVNVRVGMGDKSQIATHHSPFHDADSNHCPGKTDCTFIVTLNSFMNLQCTEIGKV